MVLMTRFKKTLLICLSLVILLYLAFCILVSHLMTSRLAPNLDITPNFISNQWKSVEFKSSDNIQLRGWFFESTSDKVIIMVPGLMANRTNSEYMGSIIARELIALGYNVLLYDTRAHGKSDGDRVGYGSVEGNDVIGAVRFLNEISFESKNIGIIADSTGATSTLMVLDKLKQVGAIIVDTPAANFEPIVSNGLWKEKLVPKLFHPSIFFFNKFLFGVDLSRIKPIEKISLDSNRKLLFLHGRLDKTTPLKNSEELLQKSINGSQLVVFEQGSHIETYKSDPDLYRKEVYQFLESEVGK